MAKIVIDARESGTTTGRYVDKLVEYLYGLELKQDITVLTKAHRLGYFAKVAPSYKLVECPHEEFTFAEQLGFRKQLDSLQPELVHFAMVQQPIWYRGKTVTTIHDLTTLRFKNPAKNPLIITLKQQVYKYVIKKAARKAAQITTPSQFVKDEVVRFTGVSPDKITVTYEAADLIQEAAAPVERLQGKQFLMYLGRPMPHKNLERLIAAFVQLQAKHLDLWLVLAGKKDANYQRIEAGVQARKLQNIYFTDFVSEGQLRWLYEHCAAYVFPSLSEGFGLPALEAMAHAAPVVSSNATCLPEIYGDAVHYFDPLDVGAMATAIDDVLTNPKLRAELVQKGQVQAKKYSWQRTAEQTLEVYERALGSS